MPCKLQTRKNSIHFVSRQNGLNFDARIRVEIDKFAARSLHDGQTRHTAFINVDDASFFAVGQTDPVAVQGVA